jgi:hypothetical protein
MSYSISQLKHFLRVALVALPVLLLLGLNGRTVSLLRPVGAPAQSQASAAPRATVIKQKVVFEAASPLGSYVAPPFALGWLPDALPTTWLPRLVRRAVAAAPLVPAGAFVALRCRQRLLSGALSPQAP